MVFGTRKRRWALLRFRVMLVQGLGGPVGKTPGRSMRSDCGGVSPVSDRSYGSQASQPKAKTGI
jgi:hypothetical protein